MNLANNMHVLEAKFVDINAWLKSVSGPCHDFLNSGRSRAFRIMVLPPCWDLCLSGDHLGVGTSVGMLYSPVCGSAK